MSQTEKLAKKYFLYCAIAFGKSNCWISALSWINWGTILVQENMQIRKMKILSFTEVVFRYALSFCTIPKGLWIGGFGLYMFSGLENSVKWKGDVFQTKEKALKYIFLIFQSLSSRQLADLFYQWYFRRKWGVNLIFYFQIHWVEENSPCRGMARFVWSTQKSQLTGIILSSFQCLVSDQKTQF